MPLYNAQVVNQCNSTHKFCSDNGYFDPIITQQLFEGSISLFQSAFFNNFEETRTEFLQPNPSTCTANQQSQTQILTIQQLGNHENDFDGNDNLDLVHYYNQNKSPNNQTTFIGNIVSFQRCAYVFNWQYDASTQTNNYYVQRYTVSIEYQNSLLRKRTIFNNKADFKAWSQSKTALGYDDFSCKVTRFYYHPGIKGIFYLMDDQSTLIFKVDRGFSSSGDPCQTNLFSNSSNIGQYKYNLKQLLTSSDYTVTSVLDDGFVFLNQQLFVATLGKTTSNQVIQSRIFKITFTITSATVMTPKITNVTQISGYNISQVAAFELGGFIVTLQGQKGYSFYKIDSSTYNTITSVQSFATNDYWRLYQSRVDNHMHRPIWGVNSTYPSAISRITTTYAQVFNDETNQTDFYNFTVNFGRYHALVLNPGVCGSLRNTSDYNNMKAVVVNLRRMEIEKCIAQSLIGCGDGKLYFSNDEECDDGNLNDGDGCSGACKIEPFYNCSQIEGQQSQCNPIICGNLKNDSGEECDDGNFMDGDGCSSTCQVEAGWECGNFTYCINKCGDGKIYQQNKTYSNGTKYTFFTEQCDNVRGCVNSTCTAVLGWTCTINTTDWSSLCIKTCGNNKHESWEVCDDGNNDSGDGCAQGCMQVEFPWMCPLVGKCSNNCGNGIFQGNDSSIGITNSVIDEDCDDGNNMDDDGCSATCEIEPGFTCKNKFQRLSYEIPIFKTVCTKDGGGSNNSGNSSIPQYYRMINPPELVFNGFSVDTSAFSGRFLLIDHNQSVCGVSFVYNVQSSSREYIKINQQENGQTTYYNEVNTGKQDSLEQYKGYQRGSFGSYYIRNKNQSSIEFFMLKVDDTDQTKITFEKFYETQSDQFLQFLGSHDIYWWPSQQSLLLRLYDGFNWKGYKFTKNVYGVSQDPDQYSEREAIQSTLKRPFTLEGQIRLHPIFYKNFIISYSSSEASVGKLRVHKYYEDIDFLAPYNEEIDFTQPNTNFRRYSLVIFNSVFGIIFKMADSSILYRYSLTSMGLTTSPSFDDNGLIDKPYSLINLSFIQRREEPQTYVSNQYRDVYGYLTTQQSIFRITANAATNKLTVAEKISIPGEGIDLSLGLIDVGLYHIAVYSGANCDAIKNKSYITSSSVYFYSFETKLWSCMPIDNAYQQNQNYAWSIDPIQQQ